MHNDNMKSKSLKSRKSVIFLPCYRDQRVLAGVYQYAIEANWILDTQYFHTGQLHDAWHGDGILCLLQVPSVTPELRRFVTDRIDTPAVDLSLNDPSVLLPRVIEDNREIGLIGAEHLISIGCRQLVFAHQGWPSAHRARYEGFCEAAQLSGINVELLRLPQESAMSWEGATWLKDHLSNNQGYLGIMAAADFLTQAILQASQQAGFTIPHDMAIMGVDNCREICECSHVTITSIDNNAFMHGYDGAKLLDSLIVGEPAPAGPVFVPPGPLHVRDSTDIMAARHPLVVAAMQYIADNYTRSDLTQSEVAAQLPITQRRLHDAFTKHTRRTMVEEIQHRRIQHAMQLIQATNRKMSDIADESGFTSAELMSRIFRRKLGHPPSIFRLPNKPEDT